MSETIRHGVIEQLGLRRRARKVQIGDTRLGSQDWRPRQADMRDRWMRAKQSSPLADTAHDVMGCSQSSSFSTSPEATPKAEETWTAF